jgi:hypothetical protein
MKSWFKLFLWFVASLGNAATAAEPADEVLTVPLPGSAPRMEKATRVLPLVFEPNLGQTDAEVKFLARGKGYQLFLVEREAVMVLQTPTPEEDAKRLGVRQPPAALPGLDSLDLAPEGWRNPQPHGDSTARLESPSEHSSPHVLRMRLAGANPAPTIRGDEVLPGKVNYFIGNDPAQWRTNIPTFGKVRMTEVYPGIDLVYYGNEGQLEYDFVLAPGANPNQIAMEFEGSDRLELDAHGDLIAWVDGRAVSWRKPVVYQEADGQRVEIAGAYRLNDASLTYQAEAPRRIGFELAAYDHSKPLVIDPVLVYSTYLGGSGSDRTYASYGKRTHSTSP